MHDVHHSADRHGADRGGGASEADVVHVPDVHDVHDVRDVHVFHHMDFARQHDVRSGPQFVRLLTSPCVIKCDHEDLQIPESVRAMTGTAQALDTEAAQNACAVHAVFGAPSHNGKLGRASRQAIRSNIVVPGPE